MFPTLLPALRVDFRQFFNFYSDTDEEMQYRAGTLVEALLHAGVVLAGVSAEGNHYCWLVFHTEQERADVHRSMQRVLQELSAYSKWEKGQDTYTTPTEK